MKTTLLFASLIFCAPFLKLSAQESIISDIDQTLLQKYTSLALQNYPRKKIFDARLLKAKAAVSVATFSWFDMFNANYYYSPTNTTGTIGSVGGVTNTNNGQIITRGLMLGASVNLGSLLSRPSVVKSAKADYEIAKSESQEYTTTLTNEVTSRYYTFLLAKRTLQLKTTNSQNYRIILNDVKVKYEKAEVSTEVYAAARNSATEAEAAALTSEVEFLKAKNALEEIIGAKLETVR